MHILVFFGFLVLLHRDYMRRRNDRQELQRIHSKKHDPFLLSALELTRAERVLLGTRAPDPNEIIMHVRFRVSENANNYESRQVVNDTLFRTWEVHANGKMVPATTTYHNEEEFVLDEDFYMDAVHYFSLPPDQRECSFSPPHMHVLDRVVRLVWHKGNWYLNGLDDGYRLAVQQLRLAQTKAWIQSVFEKAQ